MEGNKTVVEVQKYRSVPLDVILRYSGVFFDELFNTVGLPLLYWLGFYKLATHMIFVISYNLILGNIIKDLLCLPRPKHPAMNLEPRCFGEHGFVSTHTMQVIGASAVLYSNLVESSWADSSMLLLLLSLWCGVVSISRIYVGAHTPPDVIGGMFLGAIINYAYFLNSQYLFFYMTNFPLVLFAILLLILCTYPTPAAPTSSFRHTLYFSAAQAGVIAGVWRRFPTSTVLLGHLTGVEYLKAVVIRIIVGIVILAVHKLIFEAVFTKFCNVVISAFDTLSVKPKSDDSQSTKKPHNSMKNGIMWNHTPEVFTGIQELTPKQIFIKFIIYFGIGWLNSDVCFTVFEYLNI